MTDRRPPGDEVNTMRALLTVCTLTLSLGACDFPKSVGDDSDEDDGEITTSTSTSGDPSASGPDTTSTSTSTSGSPSTTGKACEPFDPGPHNSPSEYYEWSCLCETCELNFEDIPPETASLFSEETLCSCLCPEAGCGDVEGQGGVAGGDVGSSGGDTDSGWGSSTTDPTGYDTDGGTSGGSSTTDPTAGGVTTDATQ